MTMVNSGLKGLKLELLKEFPVLNNKDITIYEK